MKDAHGSESEAQAPQAGRPSGGTWDLAFFALAILGSAFLLFLVQPMVGKRLLPWYGGVPSVWTLCLAFYQITLFAGYAYAHGLIRFGRSVRLQLALHAGLFVLAFLVLPVLPGDSWKPEDSNGATGAILLTLLANVALPFLFIAATGPLVQAWFARAHPGRSPYFLYAVSNIGSLAALLLYPLLIEPSVGLADTGNYWGIAFGIVGAAVLTCAAIASRRSRTLAVQSSAAAESDSGGSGAGHPLLWLLLAGSSVVLLMGVTNELCLDTASVPFLWILPLGIYLLTFIISFASERFYARMPFVLLSAAAMILLPFTQPKFGNAGAPSPLQTLEAVIGVHSALLFFACMVMHGELFRLRPAARSLTSYYLIISLGGALGGVFVGIVAAPLFDDYAEVPIGFTLWWLLVLAVALRDQRGWVGRSAPAWRKAVAATVALGMSAFMMKDYIEDPGNVVHGERSFFGVLRVVEVRAAPDKPPQRSLRHGTTLHGVQFGQGQQRMRPTAYFGIASGVGMVLGERASGPPIRVAVVGLGIGTIAAHGRPGDTYRFYEIDPSVVDLAQDEQYFTFLSGSRADIELVEGDGRLALAAELERGEPGYDVLIMDAFNSDAPPVHLLTEEAMALYAARLAPGGILAVNISNRNLDLSLPVFRQGRLVGLDGKMIITRDLPAFATSAAWWAVLSRDPQRVDSVLAFADARRQELDIPKKKLRFVVPRPEIVERTPIWTDDYSDLLGILR